ncbi:MAG: hypothetical protein MN733_05745, partial [Nitrososphaera sp.]|nr:hypothetical protein [Nitrososphaera sp.]
MLNLALESAAYSELDFPQFNPRGFDRVRQAVEVALQAKALAQTSGELREATNALHATIDIKNIEHQIARINFEAKRQRTFDALHAALESFRTAYLPAPRHLEVENRLDHLITLFNLKDFDAVSREL